MAGRVFSMSHSTKLGIASLAMLGLSVVLAALAPEVPLAFVAGFLACIFGASAAQHGTKWWLAIPSLLIALLLLMLYAGSHAV
jgi:hypothetical protein